MVDKHDHKHAQEYYNRALHVARNTSLDHILIEALLARGRWQAMTKHGSFGADDLNEALDYALQGGYRIYEADIRIALAWSHLASGNSAEAKVEAAQALTMSQEMDYYWGKVGAEEALDKLGQ